MNLESGEATRFGELPAVGVIRRGTEALEAFRTAMSFRFLEWLNHNRDVFVAYKAALGFVWA
jgi:hypothetical protein